jgi:N-acetylmuramoyl-L-alanine amidase
MIRILCLAIAFWSGVVAVAAAQVLSGVARVDPERSVIEADWRGHTQVRLHLSQGVPFRVFTLDAPARLVVDFREVDWSGVKAASIQRPESGVSAVRFGGFQPGWSRLVAELADPRLPQEIGMAVDEITGQATLQMSLAPVDDEIFASVSGAPKDALWPDRKPEPPKKRLSGDRFVVVVDPGHGGIDPGAERDGVSEKELMLEMAFELREALMRAANIDVVLTRDRDVFVALESRVALAHQAGGDLFVSLHADALSEGGAQGATIYLLSEDASDTASAHLAARHNRSDIIAGADLTGSDDEVTAVLLDLARQETDPRSEALAQTLIRSLDAAGGPMNSRPLRRAGFSVLKSADIPSVLVEVGFLSSKRDLKNLRDPEWRSGMVAGLARGVLEWRDADQARRALLRQ